jgi:hypothetical protein
VYTDLCHTWGEKDGSNSATLGAHQRAGVEIFTRHSLIGLNTHTLFSHWFKCQCGSATVLTDYWFFCTIAIFFSLLFYFLCMYCKFCSALISAQLVLSSSLLARIFAHPSYDIRTFFLQNTMRKALVFEGTLVGKVWLSVGGVWTR